MVTLELNEENWSVLLGLTVLERQLFSTFLTGVYEPSEGTVTLDSHLLNGKTPTNYNSGSQPYFPKYSPFKDLTVLDNVLIAFGNHHKPHVLAFLPSSSIL